MELGHARQMAEKLMQQYGLKAKGWRFEFSNAKRIFGQCCYNSNFGGTHFGTIKLSQIITHLNDEHHVKDTILHEIAHALVGSGHGHDSVWRKKAIEIGCDGKRCYGHEVTQPKKPFVGTCPNGHKVHRHRTRELSCSRCSKKFDPQYKFVWKRLEVIE